MKTLHVLGFGDIEGHVGNDRLARLATVIAERAAESAQPTVLVNAGENWTGSDPESVRQSLQCLSELVPQDVVITIGNNDLGQYDKGGAPDKLTRTTLLAVKEQKPFLIAANLRYKTGELFTPPPFVVQRNETTLFIGGLANPNPGQYNAWAKDNLTFHPVQDTLQSFHPAIDAANFAVIPFHEGRDAAREAFKNFQSKAFMIVFGGHYHNSDPPEMIAPGVLYFEAGWGCEVLWSVHLESRDGAVDWTHEKIIIEESVPPHPKIIEIIRPLEETVASQPSVLCRTKEELDWPFEIDKDLQGYPRDNPPNYSLESRLGNFAADAGLWYASKTFGAKIMLLNMRSLRASIPKGDLTPKKFREEVLPERLDGSIAAGDMPLRVLLKILNLAMADSNRGRQEKHPDPIAFAGMEVVVDLDRPEERVRSIVLSDGEILVEDGKIKGNKERLIRVATRKHLTDYKSDDPPYESFYGLKAADGGKLYGEKPYSQVILEYIQGIRDENTLLIPAVPFDRLRIIGEEFELTWC